MPRGPTSPPRSAPAASPEDTAERARSADQHLPKRTEPARVRRAATARRDRHLAERAAAQLSPCLGPLLRPEPCAQDIRRTMYISLSIRTVILVKSTSASDVIVPQAVCGFKVRVRESVFSGGGILLTPLPTRPGPDLLVRSTPTASDPTRSSYPPCSCTL